MGRVCGDAKSQHGNTLNRKERYTRRQYQQRVQFTDERKISEYKRTYRIVKTEGR